MEYSSVSDVELLALFSRAPNPHLLTELFSRYQPLAYRTALRVLQVRI